MESLVSEHAGTCSGESGIFLNQSQPSNRAEHMQSRNDHGEEFKECMGSYNIEYGADSFVTITIAISFSMGRYYIQLVIQKSTTDSNCVNSMKDTHFKCHRRRATSLLEMKKISFHTFGC